MKPRLVVLTFVVLTAVAFGGGTAKMSRFAFLEDGKIANGLSR